MRRACQAWQTEWQRATSLAVRKAKDQARRDEGQPLHSSVKTRGGASEGEEGEVREGEEEVEGWGWG